MLVSNLHPHHHISSAEYACPNGSDCLLWLCSGISWVPSSWLWLNIIRNLNVLFLHGEFCWSLIVKGLYQQEDDSKKWNQLEQNITFNETCCGASALPLPVHLIHTRPFQHKFWGCSSAWWLPPELQPITMRPHLQILHRGAFFNRNVKSITTCSSVASGHLYQHVHGNDHVSYQKSSFKVSNKLR